MSLKILLFLSGQIYQQNAANMKSFLEKIVPNIVKKFKSGDISTEKPNIVVHLSHIWYVYSHLRVVDDESPLHHNYTRYRYLVPTSSFSTSLIKRKWHFCLQATRTPAFFISISIYVLLQREYVFHHQYDNYS